MKSVHDHLRQIDSTSCSHGFVDRVITAIAQFEERKLRKSILWNGGLLVVCLLLTWQAMVNAIETLQAGVAADLITAIQMDPGTLMLSDTWMAILNLFPVLTMALAIVMLISATVLFVRFIRALPFTSQKHVVA